jgi:hypothetical protein
MAELAGFTTLFATRLYQAGLGPALSRALGHRFLALSVVD